MNQFHNQGVWSPETNLTQNGSTWANDFFNFCQQAVDDDRVFETFKQHPAFTTIIGSDVRDAAFAHNAINQITNPRVRELLPKFSSGDCIGKPLLHDIEKVGSIAPGTVYHAAILDSLLSKVGEIKNFNVVEIGPGYGGQSKVLLDYGVKSCTLIDVLPVSNLQRKYLKLLGYESVQFWDTDNIEEGEWDLAISNWCLSEFNNEGIRFYVENVISRCSLGYFWMNMWEEERKSFTLDLVSKYFRTVEVFDEDVKTHTNKNWLLVVKK